MFDSGIYNYVNVLDKAADASWNRNEAISNNIANVSTPNYKRQDVSFEKELARALKGSEFESIGNKVAGIDLSKIDGEIYIDQEDSSYRLDGNNVDIDNENVKFAANQIKYNALIQSISGEFTSLQSAMKGW